MQQSQVLRCALPSRQSTGAFVGVRPRRNRALRAMRTVTMASGRSAPPLLATFDVDGTLIHAIGSNANKLHKRAFTHAFKEVYGITASVDEIEHHGSTDLLVTLAVLKHKGVSVAEAIPNLSRCVASMLAFCEKNVSGINEGLEVLPGVEAVLKALAGRPNTVTGLVTGNLEPIAWSKMDALARVDLQRQSAWILRFPVGLKQHFTTPLIGGFSSDYCSHQLADHSIDRAEFIRVAARKATAMHSLSGTPTLLHFGDTPNDIKAAVAAGAVPVGIATGAFSLEQLRESARVLGAEGSLILLADLTDTTRVLEAIERATLARA